MYKSFVRSRDAGAQYRDLELATRIESASPHGLVTILFEELLLAIATTRSAIERGDLAKRSASQSRAMAVLQSLDGSLDLERGAEVAAQLRSVYAEASRLLLAGARENDAAAVERARAMVAEIAIAWGQIG